jgi:uncharacterized protein (TIGR02646 family)
MIQINRVAEPELMRSIQFMKEKERLFAHFIPSSQTSQQRFKFSMQVLGRVRGVLLAMCNGKCAYCESSLSASYGEIEHFRPRAGVRGLGGEYAPLHYWWLAYDWENLLIACQVCNSKYKRDSFPLEDESFRAAIGATGSQLLQERALLIDPCQENPAEHLDFLQDGTVRSRTKKGEATIKILGLNRAALCEKRKEAAAEMKLLLLFLQNLDQGLGFPKKTDIIRRINALHASDCPVEYAAVQRRVFNDWYQQNAAFWEHLIENAEVEQFDTSALAPSASGESNSAVEQAEIEQVSVQLSHIKRFSIKSVEIENFKSLDKITLQIPPVNEKESRESWLLLLGDNGIGKSSILQAIALALAGQKQLDRLQLDATDYLRRGTSSGKVVIQSYEQDNSIVLTFSPEGFKTGLLEAPTFVLAYGSTRLLPKGGIQPDRNREPYLNIGNLFDYSIALSDPHEWLRHIDSDEFNTRIAPAFFDVLALRGEDHLELTDGQIRIRQFGEVQGLEDNSDGYKTIVGLVADIMQTLAVDRSTYHNAQGIVLLDEIGNHLHPRWRMKIVGALRRAFPKLQFIVTTHEPLCGLSHGEVVVLVRDEAARIRTLDHTLLPDHSAMHIDQLLTSDLFGLINVMDEEVEKTFEEYYLLLSKKTEERTTEDREKIQQLSAELAGKEMLGATPRDQILYETIGETYAELKKEGFKTTEALKKETVSVVKTLLEKQKPNWL